MAQNDYAILVGISRYADSSLHGLNGPVHDVLLMRDWLVSSSRCAVPLENITPIVSDELTKNAAIDQDLPPLFQDFLSAFMRIVRKPGKDGFIRRRDSRLYLYFSGHGFCEKSQRAAHAALYVANADRYLNWNIYGTFFAQWSKDQGLFGEIVLIMDCCRDAELTRRLLVPPLSAVTDIGAGRDVKLFELYAAPRGGKAQERPIPARNNEVHGLLTHAFLDAIDHAAPGESSVRTQAIKDYLEQRWKNICEVSDGGLADPPEIIVPANGEFSFNRPISDDLPQQIKFSALTVGSAFTLFGPPNFSEVAQVTLGAEQAKVVWADGRISMFAIENNVVVVPLPATYYMATAVTPEGRILNRMFQAGDSNVEL